MKTELNKIANAGFKTPKGYFSSFDQSMIDKINEETPKFDILEPGFAVPKGYFDSLENEVLQKINSESDTKVISLFNRRNLVYISAVAAMLLIAFTVFFNSDSNTADIDLQLVENYILNQEVNIYDIAELLTEDEFIMLDSEIYTDVLNEDLMENYLLENVSIEEIYE